jgi:CHASE2 domain-containing sensor protein
MVKQIDLEINNGDFVRGFKVSIQIREGQKDLGRAEGSLRGNPELKANYDKWRSNYLQLPLDYRWDFGEGEAKNLEELFQESRQLVDSVEANTKVWLNNESTGFQSIREKFLDEIKNKQEETIIFLRADNQLLRKLPWHLWDLLDKYNQAEIVLCLSEYGQPKFEKFYRDKVRVLAIFGNNSGIDVKPERQVLENLQKLNYIDLVVLEQPSLEELNKCLCDKKGYDILFFAGHSSSEVSNNTGWISINSKEKIGINQIKSSLSAAIRRGLQLVILNSCDGLGLAESLASLGIAQTVAMRESVPDAFAQQFLKTLIEEFQEKSSLCIAVRRARERLSHLNNTFPGALWSPVIFQNPSAKPLTWGALRGGGKHRLFTLSWTFSASFLMTTLIIGARLLGIFQSLELKAFDHLMQIRPQEEADERLLIIGADEEDIRKYASNDILPSAILAKLIEKLNQNQEYKPVAIGLDIAIDKPEPTNDSRGYQALLAQLKQNSNTVAMCSYNDNHDGSDNNYTPPPELTKDKVGFVDLFNDNLSGNKSTVKIVRRYALSRNDDARPKAYLCNTKYSFGFLLLYSYLTANDTDVKVEKDNWKFGSIITQRLETRSGGYQKDLDMSGNRLLINYRNVSNLQQQGIAKHITLRDVLEDDKTRFDPAWVRNKIVIIGYSNNKDLHYTSYGEMHGIQIHAHAISQILSAVEDKRPLLWWLPQWGDAMWVFFWSTTGVIIIWRFQAPLVRKMLLCLSIITLYGICWGFIIVGGWLPLIPSAVALVSPWIGLLIHNDITKFVKHLNYNQEQQ